MPAASTSWPDASFTLAELAAVVALASGKPLPYRDMSAQAFGSALLRAGLPEMAAGIVSDTDAGVAKGALMEEGGDLRRLIRRPTTPFQDTITQFVRNVLAQERNDVQIG